MLCALRISHLALIESLEAEFGRGLNVLSGETGAGKSTVLEALALLLGERGRGDLVRRGARQAEVQAVFDLSEAPAVRAWLGEQSLESEDRDELVLRRVLPREGRSRAWINGRLVPVGQLAALAARMAATHGQHEAQGLCEPGRQRGLFDEQGGHTAAWDEWRGAWRRWQEAARALEELESDDREWQQRLDFLRFQIEEIEAAGLRAGEEEDLRRERERLANVEVLEAGAGDVMRLLNEGGDEAPSAADLLGQAQQALARMAALDPELEEWTGELEEAAARLDDVVREISAYQSRLEHDPERLSDLQDRLELIRALERRHGRGSAAILEALERLRGEAAELEARDSRREEAAEELRRAGEALVEKAQGLTAARRRGVKKFERAVERLLRDLGMPKVRFRVAMREPANNAVRVGEAVLGPNGAEDVEFRFSANAGEEPMPFARVASGGEMSRVMLALHAMGASKSRPVLHVFDEIDTGLSGRAASRMAGVLAELAEGGQVICITHQATVAAKAAHHLLVAKEDRGGRTVTRAERLTGERRQEELARLLDGEGSVKSLELAGEMLSSAA